MCECGCGEPAPIAKTNRSERGWVKGEPLRFVFGHAARTPEWRARAARLVLSRRNRICTPATRAKRSASLLNGRDPGYSAVHKRARAVLPRECAHCGATEGRLYVALRHDGSPSARRRATNTPGGCEMSYSLKVEDYLRLCCRCHHEYDRGWTR